MELHEGDIVYVMEKCDDGWFVGTSQRTGENDGSKKICHFSLAIRNLRNFPGQLRDTDLAMAGRGNLTLATVQSAPHRLTQRLTTTKSGFTPKTPPLLTTNMSSQANITGLTQHHH